MGIGGLESRCGLLSWATTASELYVHAGDIQSILNHVHAHPKDLGCMMNCPPLTTNMDKCVSGDEQATRKPVGLIFLSAVK